MTPRPIPDPVASAPAVVLFGLASVAACFVAGYRLTAWLYDRLSHPNKENP